MSTRGQTESGAGAGGKGRRLLGEILKESGVVREHQVQEALALQRKAGGLLGEHLLSLGYCDARALTLALAEQAGLGSVDLTRVTPEADAIARVDGDTAHTLGLLPLAVRGATLVVAIADPLNLPLLDDLSFATGLEMQAAVADGALLRERIAEHYGSGGSLRDAIDAAAKSATNEDAEAAAQSAPVVRLLNSILRRAIQDRASDVHFEIFPDELRVRYRVDGALYEIEAPPVHLAAPLVARIKVMSDLDIADTKLPQDGRIEMSIDGRPVDLRVATLPGIAGEGVVLRVLDRSQVNLDLSALGPSAEEEADLRALTRLPSGIVLASGPTGSGKTTTLYSLLGEINEPSVKIVTVEDPVEYDIDGIVQVPIHEEIGVTYAKVLRTVLRQDPDRILVGEIRDSDTAAVAVEASLTGHTVYSTVHTSDAPSVVARLFDLGLEPFLITATLEAVIAQRLLRCVCASCRTSFTPNADLLRELGPDAGLVEGRELSFGKGCDQCFHTGYRGRMGIFEIMRVNPEIRSAIQAGASTDDIRALARSAGMRSLRESGLAAAASGRTTVEEVLRETMGSL